MPGFSVVFQHIPRAVISDPPLLVILHIQLARANDAEKICATDIVAYRVDAAKRFGADLALKANDYDPEKLRRLTGGRLADVVILCTGAVSAINQALASVERGGTILFFAPTAKDVKIPISVNDIFWRREVTLTSSYAATPAQHREALEMIRAKKINVKDMISHRLPLAETGAGFKLVAEAKDSLKVIIEPQRR